MRGVVFDLSLPKYALAKGLGKWVPKLYYGKGSCLELRDVPEPRLPGPGWGRAAPLFAGFCGSDLSLIYLKMSPALEPFSSMPCVLGHEILARLEEPLGRLKEGDRVAVEPLLPCRIRRIDPPCPACRAGQHHRCEAFALGHLAPGTMLGFHRDLPGAWSDRIAVHETQVFKVPDSVPDRRAALCEPMAVGLHGLLRAPPRKEDKVLVIGGGMIAMSVLGAIRLLDLPTAKRALMTIAPYQFELGRTLGATDFVDPTREPEAWLSDVCRITGARLYHPILGVPTLTGGFDVVYDCVGSRASIDSALRSVRAGGTVVLLGAAAEIEKLDWTFVWARELKILGSYCYGNETLDGKRRRTFEIVLDHMTDETRAAPLDDLVTHVHELEEVQDAVLCNVERGKHRSIKTLFRIHGGRA